jgi:hypothetical protein
MGKVTSQIMSKDMIDSKNKAMVDVGSLNNRVGVVETSLTEKETIALSVNDMKQANFKIGDTVKTLGYYVWGDGGGATYKIVTGGTGIADNGSFINLNNGLQAQLVEDSYINVKQFGAKGDGLADDSDAIIANTNWGGRLGFKVFCPQGHYKITKIVTLDSRHLAGDGWYRTYFRMTSTGKILVTGVRSSIEKIDFSPADELGSTKAPVAIELSGVTHGIFREISISGFMEGIKINASTWSNTFEKVNAYSNDIAFSLNGAEINNTAFYDCHAHLNRIGFNCLSGDSEFHYKINFFGCQIELNEDTGVYIEANGTYSFHGTFFERNNTTNQSGYNKGGLVIGFPNEFGARPATVDLVGCYHLQSNVKIKQSGVNSTTLVSNFFKDIQLTGQKAIEILNPSTYAGEKLTKVLNINPSYSAVTTVTNSFEDVFEINSNKTVGTTSQRPTNASSSQPFLDLTLNKPIWWNGYNWIDATGTTV